MTAAATAQCAVAESEPKVLYTNCPVLWLRPTQADKEKHFPHYECPVYRTTERRGGAACSAAQSSVK